MIYTFNSTTMDGYTANKGYIIEKLDLLSLFDYLVKYDHMESRLNDRFLHIMSVSTKTAIDKERYMKGCNEQFCEHFLNKHLLNRLICDNVYDSIILKSLVITGQKDVVLKYFPDFIEKSRELTLTRIDDLSFDGKKFITYMRVNALEVPDGIHMNPRKTHAMQTRQNKKDLLLEGGEMDFVKNILKSRVQMDGFDNHTDPFFKAFEQTYDRYLLHDIFPECKTRLIYRA